MKKLLLIMFCLMLAGCATPYVKQGWQRFGYTDVKLQEDVFKVTFRGNAKTTPNRAEDLALLRCAELALANGYNYFIVLGQQAGSETGAFTTPMTSQTSGFGSGSYTSYGTSGTYSGSYSGTTNYYGGQTFMFNLPSVTKTIKCFKEEPTDVQGMVFKAELLTNNIKEQYNIVDKEEKAEKVEK